jgi:hypothetical protein
MARALLRNLLISLLALLGAWANAGMGLAGIRGLDGVTAELPGADHGALASPQPPRLTRLAAELLSGPPGLDRSAVPAAHAATADFFRRHFGH